MSGRIEIVRELDEALRDRWRQFETVAVRTPYQSLAWYEAWIQTAGAALGESPLIVSAYDGQGHLTALFPLVHLERALVGVGRFAGGKHANWNYPLLRPDFVLDADLVEAVLSALRTECPDVDVLLLEALPGHWSGRANPFLHLRHYHHSAIGAVIDLAGKRGSGDASKKRRASSRKLDHAGAVVTRAATRHEVERTLSAFFRQKHAWLRGKGLDDGFGQPGLQAFFANLFSSETSGGELRYLLAGDRILAVAGLLLRPPHASLMFTSYDATAPQARHSPGSFLLARITEELREKNVRWFDLGLGEARYKEALGANPQPAYALVAPLTFKGAALAVAMKGKHHVKCMVKADPHLLRAVREIRRLAAILQWRMSR